MGICQDNLDVMHLKSLYEIPGKTVVTAHRGFSGRYPENTLTAFRKAVEVGVDIVEFDVRETSDGQLVILHDANVDRTTNGIGAVVSKPWEEVRKLNATYWSGPGKTGHRLEHAAGEEGIPLFTDALALLSGKVGLNIQVYTESQEGLNQVVQLYLDHALEDTAFLMLRSFAEAEYVRSLNPRVAICVGEQRDNLERHLAFGVDFLQPRSAHITEDYMQRLLAAGLPHNVFYANTEEDMRKLIALGVKGIMTDFADILLSVAAETQSN